jgi:hypothetical protein
MFPIMAEVRLRDCLRRGVNLLFHQREMDFTNVKWTVAKELEVLLQNSLMLFLLSDRMPIA